jgi:hypothetical protein
VSAWFVDRCLPGLVTSAIWVPAWTAALWLSHRKLRRHIDTAAARQDQHFDALTAEQTAALRDPQAPGGAR